MAQKNFIEFVISDDKRLIEAFFIFKKLVSNLKTTFWFSNNLYKGINRASCMGASCIVLEHFRTLQSYRYADPSIKHRIDRVVWLLLIVIRWSDHRRNDRWPWSSLDYPRANPRAIPTGTSRHDNAICRRPRISYARFEIDSFNVSFFQRDDCFLFLDFDTILKTFDQWELEISKGRIVHSLRCR